MLDERITGTQVAYYMVCKRKLWFFTKGIEMENSNDSVIIGKVISQEAFKREKYREVVIGETIKVDFIRIGKEIVVHEVKKSRKMEEAHIWQVKFYMYSLRKFGVPVNMGIIHYPKIMKKMEVTFDSEDEKKIEESLSQINLIKNLEFPPAVINKPFCKNCAYYELCYV
ncbi:MAG: CRISPR-associated protein Cas4 [Candidatus Calescibacterium sp.]|nr:CRISPR-associated protein Cas4 [Candidatus Calescibacterium sp.]